MVSAGLEERKRIPTLARYRKIPAMHFAQHRCVSDAKAAGIKLPPAHPMTRRGNHCPPAMALVLSHNSGDLLCLFTNTNSDDARGANNATCATCANNNAGTGANNATCASDATDATAIDASRPFRPRELVPVWQGHARSKLPGKSAQRQLCSSHSQRCRPCRLRPKWQLYESIST